jgi:hypothetical protein
MNPSRTVRNLRSLVLAQVGFALTLIAFSLVVNGAVRLGLKPISVFPTDPIAETKAGHLIAVTIAVLYVFSTVVSVVMWLLCRWYDIWQQCYTEDLPEASFPSWPHSQQGFALWNPAPNGDWPV